MERGKPKNCLTCANRVKSSASMDTNGGDFWDCTAVPVLPEFAGHQLRFEGRGMSINLNSFRDGHPCQAYQLARDCGLWLPAPPNPG